MALGFRGCGVLGVGFSIQELLEQATEPESLLVAGLVPTDRHPAAAGWISGLISSKGVHILCRRGLLGRLQGLHGLHKRQTSWAPMPENTAVTETVPPPQQSGRTDGAE